MSRDSNHGTFAPRHSLATTADDGYIPFGRHDGLENERGRAVKQKTGQAKERRIDQDARKDADWHAELEILSPTPDHEQNKEQSGHGQAENGSNLAVDGVGTPERPATTITDEAQPPKSRTEGRLQRKLRRMEAGTYRAAADASSKQEGVEKQVETVLAKLEGLSGPRLAKRSAGTRVAMKGATEEDRKAINTRGESAALLARTKKADMDTKREKTSATKQLPKPDLKHKKETWQAQKDALEHKFGEAGWQPRKRLSPDTLEGIRALHASDPTTYSTELLSEHFKVTPEAIRRILKSKWKPSEEETDDRRARWERRGAKKWQEMAEQGVRAPAKWRAMGIGGEEGLKEEKLPKRRRVKRRDDGGLSWDESVADIQAEEEELVGGGLAERFL